MAASSDKARFFIEQSIPELKEYERKKIFSPAEINSITKRRSNFEHKVSAPGTQPSDYARYAEFEINVDSLRKKRVNRLKIKSVTYAGQRRTFFILDRATRRFPGDIGLLMQQIEYARSQKAHKRLSQILTRALRLHPKKPDLWVYAAFLAMDVHADITEARSYMQRGLRFCKTSKTLWLEYTRIELLYLVKIFTRRDILGLTEIPEVSQPDISQNEHASALVNSTLPTRKHDGLDESDEAGDHAEALQDVYKSSALTGGIPITIFDTAMTQFEDDEKLAYDIFDAVQCAGSIRPLHCILVHVVSYMEDVWPKSWRTLLCRIKLSCVGIPASSPDFPKSFGQALKALQQASLEARTNRDFVEAMQAWLNGLLDTDYLDFALREIMVSTLKQLQTAAGLLVHSK